MEANIARPLESVVTEPWRNGRGVTRPLASSGDDWRVSLAQVDQDGPYSRFEGMQRTSVVVSGEGILLQHQQTQVELPPFAPARYDGEHQWFARLYGGPVMALNVMTRKGRYQATVRSIVRDTIVPPGGSVVIVAFNGACSYAVDGARATAFVSPGFWTTLRDLTKPLRVGPLAAQPDIRVQHAALLVSIAPVVSHGHI
jgi:environmental stress-induced protein Ves